MKKSLIFVEIRLFFLTLLFYNLYVRYVIGEVIFMSHIESVKNNGNSYLRLVEAGYIKELYN